MLGEAHELEMHVEEGEWIEVVLWVSLLVLWNGEVCGWVVVEVVMLEWEV